MASGTTEIPYVRKDETFKTWRERTNQMIQQQNNFVHNSNRRNFFDPDGVKLTIYDAWEQRYQNISNELFDNVFIEMGV